MTSGGQTPEPCQKEISDGNTERFPRASLGNDLPTNTVASLQLRVDLECVGDVRKVTEGKCKNEISQIRSPHRTFVWIRAAPPGPGSWGQLLRHSSGISAFPPGTALCSPTPLSLLCSQFHPSENTMTNKQYIQIYKLILKVTNENFNHIILLLESITCQSSSPNNCRLKIWARLSRHFRGQPTSVCSDELS